MLAHLLDMLLRKSECLNVALLWESGVWNVRTPAKLWHLEKGGARSGQAKECVGLDVADDLQEPLHVRRPVCARKRLLVDCQVVAAGGCDEAPGVAHVDGLRSDAQGNQRIRKSPNGGRL